MRKPELRVLIDRDAPPTWASDVQDVAATLRLLVGGEPVSKYKEADEQYDIWLRADAAPPDARTRIDVT